MTVNDGHSPTAPAHGSRPQ